MIGVFGGTFDPVHLGHLRPALELMEELSLDRVAWIPCGQPPHRVEPVASPEQRLRMLDAAVEGVPGFYTDQRELRRQGPSYMVDTLESLRQELVHERLCLLLGMDAFLGFTAWHQWRRILDLAHIVVAERPGWERPQQGALAEVVAQRTTERVQDLRTGFAGRVLFRAVTQLEISATEIRARVAAGHSARFLVPDRVREVIEQDNIYGAAAIRADRQGEN
jgi:nicotinate-nucleotide adenylyltransferase